MCVVSMVGDMFTKTIPNQPFKVIEVGGTWNFEFPVTRQEFDALKREVEELGKLLRAAKAYDAATGQPDCETEDKMALLRALAKHLGVELGV